MFMIPIALFDVKQFIVMVTNVSYSIGNDRELKMNFNVKEVSSDMCVQRRSRSVCIFALSVRNLH